MLVVLVVMGVAVGGSVLAMRPAETRQLATEAERLALLLDMASEESRLGGMPLAWVGAPEGYAFQRRELTGAGPAWTLLQEDSLLHPRTLPAGLAVASVAADGRPLDIGSRLDLGPLGVRHLVIELALGDARSRIVGLDGRFTVSAAEEGAL